MSHILLQSEQEPAALEAAESQNLVTADGVPIAQLQENDKIYFRSNAQGPWGVYIFVSYDPTKQSVHLGIENSNCRIITSPSHCSVTRPTEGVVLGTPKEQQAYALHCSIKIGQMLNAVSESCKQGIQILLELELAGIDPIDLFQSLKAEFPKYSDEAKAFQPNQPIVAYDTVGTYVPATILRKIPDKDMWEIQRFDSPSMDISRQFIQSKLPKGKRLCRTQEQLDAFARATQLAGTDDFSSLDPLTLAGLAKAFLKQ